MEAIKRFAGAMGILLLGAGAVVFLLMRGHPAVAWSLVGAGALLAAGGLVLNLGEVVDFFRGRPVRYGAHSVFYSLIVLAIVLAVNFLASRHNRRFDLTSEGLHTLSPQTVKILKSLDQDVSLVAFYIPGSAERQKAIDLIDLYKEQTSRIATRILDPSRNPAQARAFKLDVVPTVIVSSEAGKSRVTPSTFNPLTEEQLTNALIATTTKNKPVVCLTTGHGEGGMDDPKPRGFQRGADALRQENVELREVRLLESGSSLDECSSVLVAGPTHAMLEAEIRQFEQYLDQGGKALVLREARTQTGLEPVLERYGLKANDDVIVDVNPLARVMGGSPAMPVVYEYGTNAIVRDFQGLATIFPTVGSVQIVDPSDPDVRVESLARTSEQSWGELGDLQVPVSLDPATEKIGPLNVAAVATREHEDEGAAAAEDPSTGAEKSADGTTAGSGKKTRIVLFGDYDFASNSYLMKAGNEDLLLNTVAWLNERSDLVSIRAKRRTSQQLMLTSEQWMILLFYGLLMLPAILTAQALHVFLKRRRL